jgi:AraC-like DNA-binding protein
MHGITEQTAEREKASHGDIFLPVNSYHCLVPLTYRELALHWHEEMEITLIREGTSDYRVGQRSFRTQEGDIILVPPYCTHSAFEIPGRTMVSDSLVFHLDLLGAQGQDLSASKYLRPLAEGQLQMPEVIRPSDRGYDEIREVFLKALECFQNRPSFYEMLLREELLHIVILLFQFGYISKPDGSRNSQTGRQQLKTVLQYIDEHYREKIKVADLADMSGFSESYFMSFFRQYVGMSCISYINHYRIQKAAHALEETSGPVMEIAMDHGFDNISYFNLQFRREFGMTPRQFRMRQKEGA